MTPGKQIDLSIGEDSMSMRNVSSSDVNSDFEVRIGYLYYELCYPSYFTPRGKRKLELFHGVKKVCRT